MTPFRPVGRTHDEIARESGQRFAAALPEPVYLISLHHADEQRTRQHHWPLQRIEQATAYLRARNARRWHIHGRPWSARHVLVDDLTPETLERLAAHHLPAAVVATSPGRLQAWLTLSASHIAPEHARAVARLLARRYGGDPGATSPLQPGRWPGYTNPKPGYRDAQGRFPYARLVSADGPCVTQGAAALLAEAREVAARAAARGAALPTPPSSRRALPRRGRLTPRTPECEAAEAGRRIVAWLPADVLLDRSRLDAAIARRLLRRGATPEHVAATIAAGEKARSLPPGEAETYAQRTLAAAMRDATGP